MSAPGRKILCTVGTRPEIVKMAPVIRALRATSWADVGVVATGQHRELATAAFEAFGITPGVTLDVMVPGQTLSSLTGRLFTGLEAAIGDAGAHYVIAQGDTTTVMATAMTCFYLGVPFAHLEAGLRTGDLDNPFPEELNRVICGRVARLNFAPTATAGRALLAEGVDPATVVVTGNTVIDALYQIDDMPGDHDPDRKLILLTAHRRENFGAPLEQVFTAIRDIVGRHPDVDVIYPVHPNPQVRAAAERLLGQVPRVRLCEPLPYRAFVATMKRAYLVVSDSGGVQEEAPALGKPVLVIRRETERPEAVAAGVARLIGTDYGPVCAALEALLTDRQAYRAMARGVSPYGDGRAADRVVDALAVSCGLKPARSLADFDSVTEPSLRLARL